MGTLDTSADMARERKKISVGLLRILHRTASPNWELMKSFWERDAVSLHVLTHDQMLLHLAELSGPPHCV